MTSCTPGPMPQARLASRGVPARTRLTTEERRAQFVTVGRLLYSTRPFDALSVEDIAREAGVARGLLYHYFNGKAELYHAALAAEIEDLHERMAVPEGVGWLDSVRHGLGAFVDHFAEAAQGFLTALARAGSDPQVAALVDGMRRSLVDQLVTSLGDPPSPRLRLALAGWVGFVETTTARWVTGADVGRDELVDLQVAQLVAALNACGLGNDGATGSPGTMA